MQCVLPRTMQYVLCMLYLRAANNTCMLCLRPQRRPALPHRRRGRRRIQSAPPAARRPPVEREQVAASTTTLSRRTRDRVRSVGADLGEVRAHEGVELEALELEVMVFVVGAAPKHHPGRLETNQMAVSPDGRHVVQMDGM